MVPAILFNNCGPQLLSLVRLVVYSAGETVAFPLIGISSLATYHYIDSDPNVIIGV